MVSITLRVRSDSSTLSELCHDYGGNRSLQCPSGTFVCPFVNQDENGSWIYEKPCTEITPSDWERFLKDDGRSEEKF